MKSPVINLDNKKAGEIDLDDTVFGLPVRLDILNSAVNWHLSKRHTAPKQNDPGGIKELEGYVDISNVAVEDPKDGKPTRVGFKFLKEGKKVRFAKRSGEVIDS